MAALTVERRAALRSSGEVIREVVRLKELQYHFITYRSKVEVAVDALKDIARELHMLDMAGARRRQAGHFTSGVGSGVLGGALVAGVITTGPLLTLGLFAGTVLSSVGGLITFTGREGKRVRELEVQVTAVLLAVEREFEACQQKLQECEGSTEGLEHLRLQVALAESERPGGLQVVARILGNVATFADGLSSRVSSLPREVRSLLDGGLHQVQYFISPYGASALVNLLKGERVSPTGPVVSANTTSLPENLLGAMGSTPAASSCEKKSLFASCGKLGKVAYTVGAVVTFYELYNSVTKVTELTKKLQRLKDSSDLFKYEGAAKDVFNIAMDLQLILSTVFKTESEE